MYKHTDKICDLMAHEEEAIQIISRFGLEMGVGDQTIEQVCATHGVHTPTFLAVVNYKVFKDSGIRSQESGCEECGAGADGKAVDGQHDGA